MAQASLRERQGVLTDQAHYTTTDLYRALSNYFRMAQVGHMERPEERIGSKPAPAHEAATNATSRLKADIETAMIAAAKKQGFEAMMITFFDLSVGATSLRASERRQRGLLAASWRSKVAELWGLQSVSRVTAVRERFLHEMAEVLNVADKAY